MNIILFGSLFGIGLFFVLADVFKLPTIATQKAIITATKRTTKKTSSIDTLLNNLSLKISKIIIINEYKKVRLKNTLNAAGLAKTPEEYMASCIVKSLLIAVGIIPCLLIFPIASPVLMVYSNLSRHFPYYIL